MEFDSNFSNYSTNNAILGQFNTVFAELGPAQPHLVFLMFANISLFISTALLDLAMTSE